MTMNIGLIAVDSTYPNLALMKLSAWHKSRGDAVEWYTPFSRVNHWRSRGGRFLPHAQPYRDVNNPHHIVPQWQKDLAGWADKKQVFRTCEFKDFEPRKGFRCRQYFERYEDTDI